MRGHVAPAMSASAIVPADEDFAIEMASGLRLARCLRCDCWVPHVAPTGTKVKFEHVPAIDSLDKPRRGHALNEAIGMRLIALNKASHALGFTLVAIALALVRTNLFKLQRVAQRGLDSLEKQLDQTGQQDGHDWLQRHLEDLLKLRSHALGLLLALALGYAILEWTEAFGLWFEKRWAEYLTVIATAGFLPLEVHELLDRVTVLRAGAFVVNVALIVWLIWNKRLFGVRGGLHALQHHDDVDWPYVLDHPTPAEGRLRP
jgi:uncharacterized membrane protein (DUF2068 family)